jgi:hypothetical protein
MIVNQMLSMIVPWRVMAVRHKQSGQGLYIYTYRHYRCLVKALGLIIIIVVIGARCKDIGKVGVVAQ